MSSRERRRAEERRARYFARRFRPIRPIKRFGQRFFGAARLGVQQGSPGQRDLIPEGKAVRYRYRDVPAIPGRVLYDGTKVKAQKAVTLKLAELADEGRAPPPLFRRGGLRELFLLMLLLPVFLGFGAFRGLNSQISLTNLPFIDLTNPAYNVNNAGTDTYTTLQAVFTANGAATYYGGYASIYTSSKPILYAPGTWVVGAGVNRRQTTSGTTFRVASGAVAADWAGQGYFTSLGFASNAVITGLGEICGFRDFLVDCNGQSYGNGILTAGIAQPHFINLRWENYLGNQGMPTRGSGVSKAFGQGFGLCTTAFMINGNSATSSTNPNDPLFWNCRQTPLATGPNNATGTFSSSPLIWTDDDGSSSITDGIILWCQPEGGGARAGTAISNQAAIAQGIVDIQHAGGWHLDFLHLNGPGGQGLVMRNCMATHLTNSWLDGWGSAATNGSTFDQIQATSTTGGAASNTSLTIWGNTVRVRDEQTNGGGTVVYNWLNYNASAANASLIVTGNNGFVQSALTTGTLFLFKFALGGGVINALIDNNQFLSETGAVIEDARVFDTSIPNASIIVRGNNNSWNVSATPTPTTGNWPKGYRRFNLTPAAGLIDYSVCTAGGAPGTWSGRYIPATSTGVGVFFPFVNFGTTSITVTALRCYVVPVWIPELIPILTGIGWTSAVNTTGGNYAAGLYDSTGALIVQSTSAAFPAAGMQDAAFSAAQTNVVPGKYFLVWASELGTLNAFRGNGNCGKRAAFQSANAATAPASVVTLPGTLGALSANTDAPNVALY